MSISIKNLFHDVRDVGKTIKSTKKYFVWEFVLNAKYHKVEMFHSKMSGKKKLCVDAQTICEEKSYKNDFTYSFKVEKNYFNVIQLNNEKYDLRIDNRSFDILIQEERSGRLNRENENSVSKKEKKNQIEEEPQFGRFEQVPPTLRTASRSSLTNNPRNSNPGNFFTDTDFDFNNNNNNNLNIKNSTQLRNNPDKSINSYANFNEFNSKFSNNNNSKLPINRSNTVYQVNNHEHSNKVKSFSSNSINNSTQNNKEILNQINFNPFGMTNQNETTRNNTDVFKHNQNVLNNFKINDDVDYRVPVNNGDMNFNNRTNNPVSRADFFDNNHNQLGNGVNKPFNVLQNQNPTGFELINCRNSIGSNNNGLAIDMNYINNNGGNSSSDTPKNQNANDFKQKLIGSGLVNLDNLFDDMKRSNSTTNQNKNMNYNFQLGYGEVPLNYMNDKSSKTNSNYPLNHKPGNMAYSINNNNNNIMINPFGNHIPGERYQMNQMQMNYNGPTSPLQKQSSNTPFDF